MSSDAPAPDASSSRMTLDDAVPLVPKLYRPQSASELWYTVKTFSPAESLKRLSTKECARNSLLVGMSGGAAIGVVRFAASRRLNLAVAWSLGSFSLISGAAFLKCRQDKINRQVALREGVEKYMAERGFVKTGSGVAAPPDEAFGAEETIMITAPADGRSAPPPTPSVPPRTTSNAPVLASDRRMV